MQQKAWPFSLKDLHRVVQPLIGLPEEQYPVSDISGFYTKK